MIMAAFLFALGYAILYMMLDHRIAVNVGGALTSYFLVGVATVSSFSICRSFFTSVARKRFTSQI
jgi:hypothetical protein